jgi:hypothetical protein
MSSAEPVPMGFNVARVPEEPLTEDTEFVEEDSRGDRRVTAFQFKRSRAGTGAPSHPASAVMPGLSARQNGVARILVTHRLPSAMVKYLCIPLLNIVVAQSCRRRS